MDFDNSWEALLKPGEATKYFDVHRGEPFQATASTYSKINAWWLAEISRLIYKDDAVGPGTRQEFLDEVGMKEEHFFEGPVGSQEDTQCAIVRPSDPDRQTFAILVFRGTSNIKDALTDVKAVPVNWEKGGQVYEGFLNALNSVWDEVDVALNQFECPLFYTGHSLGAALATLAASRRPPRALYTYGSPFVGNAQFTATLSGPGVFRVVNNRDVVTTVPPELLSFKHIQAGELHYIAHDGQILLNPTDQEIDDDRSQRDTMNPQNSSVLRHFTQPPEFLADHTPVNYVAHLERAF